MPAALRKPAETDTSRRALADAIAAHRQSAAALAAQQRAIHRAGEAVREIEREIAKVATAVPAAEPTTITMREAREAHQELADRLTLALAELERHREQLTPKELNVAFAANAVVVERNALLAPVAAAVLARIRAHRLELLKDRCLLATVINADADVPQSPQDPRSFFQIREAEAARRHAFGEVRAEAARDAADLATAPNGCNLAECETAYTLTEGWKRELAELLKNPHAKLPGEK